jgi:L-alanine-DL-glutamate epimerase-like enolase superfamily enzyme
MKIRSVRATWLHAAIPPEKQHTTDFGRIASFDSTLVRIETAGGLVGLGEAKAAVGSAGTNAALCSCIEDELAPQIVGEDARDISRLWDVMYNGSRAHYAIARGHAFPVLGRRGLTISAISGIDMALWDILGKVAAQPVHQLLGGARKTRHATYASDLAPADPSPEAMLEQAQGHIGAGYRAMKFGWGSLGTDPRSDARQIGRIRQAIGDDADIMVDMGFAVPLEDAIYLGHALAEHRVFFLEEPLSPDDIPGFARLTAVSPTPIATGEKESTQYPYIDLMDRGGLRIIQPDVARVGGISETMRIAALAESRGVRVIPHCWSTDILVAATLHVIATLRDCPYLEYNVTDNPLRTDLPARPLRPRNGEIDVPTAPGLGIELNHDTIAKYRIET